MAMPLFEGPNSLRDQNERVAFWATAILALPAALLIGFVLHESIGASQVALFIVVAMVYVTLARGRLLGSSVRVHEAQYPRVFSIVKSTCAALDIPMPLVFVREDNFVPVAALGFGEPYSLVLSSHWIEVYEDDELAFAVGRELSHIAAGHTRFLSLLSVNGNENPIVSMIFGAWLRRCTTTCDKVGLLCCGSLDAAIRSMGVSAFHEFARKVDFDVFAKQQTEIESDTIFRWGVWLGSEPYATTRIASLRAFMLTPAYEAARAWFQRERDEEPPAIAAPGTTTVAERDCAGWWRRFAAYIIDAVVVTAVITSFGGSVINTHANRDSDTAVVTPGHVSVKYPGGTINIEGRDRTAKTSTHPTAAPTQTPSPAPTASPLRIGPFSMSEDGPMMNLGNGDVPITADNLTAPLQRLGFAFWFPVYLALLVAVAGQTFGMMITGLRVVTTDFRRPGIMRTIGRYLIVGFIWWIIVPVSLFKRRVLLHDRWTKTRLVKVERVVARATGTN
ncbi:MAG TPA: RDD family protein [Candidatus Baltobacteraceae bacterium]|nr:RDD family protein [Candidatus Baltobacteraceae bacterium]